MLETLICHVRARLDGKAFVIDSDHSIRKLHALSRRFGFEKSKVENIRLELQFVDLLTWRAIVE